jgi:hypothetical protein
MDARGTRWTESAPTSGRNVALGWITAARFLVSTLTLAIASCLALGLPNAPGAGALQAQLQIAGRPNPPAYMAPSAGPVAAAEVTTRNFIIRAPSPQLAQQAAQLAEKYRRELSLEWLGYEIAPWDEKCPVQVIIDRFPGGETSFAFVRNDSGEQAQPIGWQMKVFGPPDRLLDAVLPHEITHTIFATHFGRPLPRWADEGACTTVEHESERAKNHRLLIDFLTGKPSRGIPFNRMFTMTEYPHDILPLYAQGYSLAKFLIRQRDRQTFVAYIGEGLQRSDSRDSLAAWNEVTQKYYGYKDLSDLQLKWLKWVESGSPLEVPSPNQGRLASAPENKLEARGIVQSVAADTVPPDALPNATAINGSWATAPRESSNSVAPTGPVTLAGLVQGSWYRQQMATGVQTSNQSGASAAPADSFRPGSVRSANPEVILRRPSLMLEAKE